MLKLPPPIWTLAYLLIAIGTSYVAGWPLVSGLPLVPLAVALIVLGLALSISAVVLFGREEINPTSVSNRKLVTAGPFKFSRNPIYLGLVIVTLGIAFLGRYLADVPGSRRDLCNGELGPYSVRGSEDAQPVWRSV
jgi:protein-S-isoprenylcysteine O-methyltransferase Ste14